MSVSVFTSLKKEKRPMQKKTVKAVLTLLLMLYIVQAPAPVLAQEGEYQTTIPAIRYLPSDHSYNFGDGNLLLTTLYVSDEEILYSGQAHPSGSWLIHSTSNAEMISHLTFPDAPGKNPIISCLSKVGDTLMLGFIDRENQSGTIGLLSKADAKVTYVTVQKNVQVMSMEGAIA